LSEERPPLITYKKLVSIPVAIWLLITSYALGINQYVEGLIVTGALVVSAFVIPFLFSERESYYDALVFSPMYIGYVLMVNVAYSVVPAHIAISSSLYVALITLLSAAIPLAWNFSSKLSLLDLTPQVLILYFISFSTSYFKPLNLYSNLFILSLSLTFIRSFKGLLGMFMVLSLTLLPFLGAPYMVTDLSMIPYINLGIPETSVDIYGYAILITYLTLLTCSIPAGYVSLFLSRKFRRLNNIYDALWNATLLLTPPLVFTLLYFILMSSITQLFKLRYLYLNLLLITLLTLPNSLFKGYLEVRGGLIRSTNELRSRYMNLRARVERLGNTLSKTRSSGMWGEELNPLNERLDSLARELESLSNVFKKSILKNYEISDVSKRLNLIEDGVSSIEESLVNMYNEAIRLATQAKAILTVSFSTSKKSLEPYTLELNEVNDINKVGELVEETASYLSSLCDEMYELVEYNKHIMSEALGISLIDLNTMKCGEYPSRVKALESVLNVYVRMARIAGDEVNKIYGNLLKIKNIATNLVKAFETSSREELLSVNAVFEVGEILKELPETLDRTARIAGLSGLITLIERLTEVVVNIPEGLKADLEKTLEYLNKRLPGKVDIVRNVSQRYRRRINSFISKLDLEALTTARNYVVKSDALLKIFEEGTQTFMTLVRDLTYLRSLAHVTPLLLDYIDYKLRSKGFININELPFKAEVTAWILRIVMSLREDIEVENDKLMLKR